jgi:hypothetical protein
MEDAGSGVLDSGMTNNGRQELPMTADLMAGIFLVTALQQLARTSRYPRALALFVRRKG